MPTVGIEGLRVYYEEQGSGSPLLLIHGTGGNTGAMAALADRLSSTHRVITYDRRGFARTVAPPPKRKDYLRRHADDAALLLRELGAPRAVVFGWSMGAVIALALAVHHPDAVSQLVLQEPPLHAKRHGGVRLASAVGGAVALGKVGMARRGAKRFARFALSYGGERGTAFDEIDPATRESILVDASAILAELRAGTGEELSRENLAKVRCPVGFIVGGRSAKFLIEATDRCAQLFPVARTIRVPTGDHVMALRQPDALARAIRDSLRITSD
jgi:pimeloyl-ACP methyl ester carboxylesterase